jgi:hypothetical protein
MHSWTVRHDERAQDARGNDRDVTGKLELTRPHDRIVVNGVAVAP